MRRSNDKKEAEMRVLHAARCVCPILPEGEIQAFTEPDLRIETKQGYLYVEITEIVRPEQKNGIRPVETENFHSRVMQLAEDYYHRSGSPPLTVYAYFTD